MLNPADPRVKDAPEHCLVALQLCEDGRESSCLYEILMYSFGGTNRSRDAQKPPSNKINFSPRIDRLLVCCSHSVAMFYDRNSVKGVPLTILSQSKIVSCYSYPETALSKK